MRYARALLAALLSSILPGTGHLLSKHWRRAAALIGGSVLVLIAALMAWAQGTDTLLGWLVQPRVLLGLLGVNLALLCFRLFAVIDSYRAARTPAPAGRALLIAVRQAALGVLVLATVAPHMAAGYYNWQAYQLLTTVFVADGAVDPTATAAVAALDPTATPTNTPTNTPTAAASLSVGAPQGTPVAVPTIAPEPTAPATPAPTPTPTPGLLVGEDRLNILLLGGDAGPERRGLRTDTMIVASIDPATGQAALFGVPRNLHNVPLPEPAASRFPCRCWPDLLNALYGYAQQHPDLFPAGGDPGAAALQGTIGELLGIEIDYYALVDLGGFVDVIDALGGVTLHIPEATTVRVSPPNEDEAWETYRIPAGRQHLDGRTALAYIRWRTGTENDYDRMERQRCVLSAVAREADPPTLLAGFPRLASVVKERVTTDVPVALLPDLIKLAATIDADAITSIGFAPPDYNAGWTSQQYPIPDVDLIQRTVATVFDPPTPVASDQVASSGTTDTATADVDTAAARCGWTE